MHRLGGSNYPLVITCLLCCHITRQFHTKGCTKAEYLRYHVCTVCARRHSYRFYRQALLRYTFRTRECFEEYIPPQVRMRQDAFVLRIGYIIGIVANIYMEPGMVAIVPYFRDGMLSVRGRTKGTVHKITF